MINLAFQVGISPSLGVRGIIATKDIKKNQIIEKCPLILVPISEEPYLKQTVLWKYYYEWNAKFHCIVLGYGSLINHSYTPNARYIFDFKNKLLIFKAFKNIKAGEEILVNYNFYPYAKEPPDPIHQIASA